MGSSLGGLHPSTPPPHTLKGLQVIESESDREKGGGETYRTYLPVGHETSGCDDLHILGCLDNCTQFSLSKSISKYPQLPVHIVEGRGEGSPGAVEMARGATTVCDSCSS